MEIPRLRHQFRCGTTAGAWTPGPDAPMGYLALAVPFPRGLGSLEHRAGCKEGLQHCCLPHWVRPSALGKLGEDPKTSSCITGSWGWGSGSPVASWAAQPFFQVNKSISNYGWDPWALCCFVLPQHCGAAVALVYPVGIHFWLCVAFEYLWFCLKKLKWKVLHAW